MTENIQITADSTCDLSPELIKQHNILINPLYIVKGDQSYKDGLEISPEDIYAYFDETGNVTKTSASSVEDYRALFAPLVEQGKSVIHVNISHGFSSCFQNACIAAEEFENVHVVDSMNLSTGSGHIVLKAAELSEQGMPAAQVAEQVRRLAPKVEASFVIDTLTYLHKGGRCSSVAALGANLLKLKPCIEVMDGKMHVGKKFRGALIKCMEEYVIQRLKDREDIDYSRIFITHTSCPPEIVARVRQLVEQYGPFQEVIETVAGCTITSHCGPHTLGILFLRK